MERNEEKVVYKVQNGHIVEKKFGVPGFSRGFMYNFKLEEK